MRDHGTHVSYVIDRCRCDECRAANREYERSRAQRVEPPYVRADPARKHVAWLSTMGVGRKQVAKVSGVAHGTLCKLMFGDPARKMGPSKRIRPATHEAIMAVTPADLAPGNLCVIPAAPTWVLIEEMTAAGVPKSAINHALGKSGPGLQISRRTISPVTRDKIRELYAWWMNGSWAPVRRDSWGNRTPCPPPAPRPVTAAERAAAYDDRLALMTALAEAIEARIERPWRNLAACRGRPPRLWFPVKGDAETAAAAIKICRACPVRRDCLMANLNVHDGIYGGLTSNARGRLRAELAEHPDNGVMATEHGTVRGYRQHLHAGETACARCKAAQARYQREYQQSRRDELTLTGGRCLGG